MGEKEEEDGDIKPVIRVGGGQNQGRRWRKRKRRRGGGRGGDRRG